MLASKTKHSEPLEKAKRLSKDACSEKADISFRNMAEFLASENKALLLKKKRTERVKLNNKELSVRANDKFEFPVSDLNDEALK